MIAHTIRRSLILLMTLFSPALLLTPAGQALADAPRQGDAPVVAAGEEGGALTTPPGPPAGGGAEDATARLTAEAERQLAALLEACGDQDSRAAARLIVYRGADAERRWVDTANPDSPQERAQAALFCRRVQRRSQSGARWRVKGFEVKEESEGRWYILRVSHDGSSREIEYEFMRVKGRLALADLDVH